MAKAEISLDDVTALEEALLEAKQTKDDKKVKRVKESLAPLRRAYREQEILAGRRTPGVAVVGDAEKVD